jgi:hypothetical protein
MVLGWPPSKLCPVIPTSNQDGRHAKNRKIYSGFFCEIFLSADIYRLCKLGIFWRLKCEMLTDGRWTKSDDNSSHGLKARWANKDALDSQPQVIKVYQLLVHGRWFSLGTSTSVSAVLYPRWPPWLKIEISSNGQNCSILSQNVPKFELYKHNDELFNIYYSETTKLVSEEKIFMWISNRVLC